MYSPAEIAIAIHDLRLKDGISRDEAIQRLEERLGEKAQLSELIKDGLIRYTLSRAEQEFGLARNQVAPPKEGEGKRFSTLARVMDVEVAIANTGVRKRLGDVTRKDALIISSYCHQTGMTWTRMGKTWKGIATKIPADGKLEDVADQLTEKDMKELPKGAKK